MLIVLPRKESLANRSNRSFVLTLFDIFKHFRELKSVDKIKKYRRDSLGEVHSPWPLIVTSPFGFGDNQRPR